MLLLKKLKLICKIKISPDKGTLLAPFGKRGTDRSRMRVGDGWNHVMSVSTQIQLSKRLNFMNCEWFCVLLVFQTRVSQGRHRPYLLFKLFLTLKTYCL